MNAIALHDPSLFLFQKIHSDSGKIHRSEAEQACERSLRILAVDDEPSMLEIYEMYLSGEGHTLGAASGGRDGFHRFRESEWDLVIVDCCMPGMNGVELAAVIKGLAPETPIMMVTGATEISDEKECHSVYVDSVVKKPFTRGTLLDGISKALTRCAA